MNIYKFSNQLQELLTTLHNFMFESEDSNIRVKQPSATFKILLMKSKEICNVVENTNPDQEFIQRVQFIYINFKCFEIKMLNSEITDIALNIGDDLDYLTQKVCEILHMVREKAPSIHRKKVLYLLFNWHRYTQVLCTLDVIFSSIFRFCITKPPKKLSFNLLYTKHI